MRRVLSQCVRVGHQCQGLRERESCASDKVPRFFCEQMPFFVEIKSARLPSCSYDEAFGLRALSPPCCLIPMAWPFLLPLIHKTSGDARQSEVSDDILPTFKVTALNFSEVTFSCWPLPQSYFVSFVRSKLLRVLKRTLCSQVCNPF